MSITCPKCQHENPDGTLYCGKCARALTSAEGISMTKTLVTERKSLEKGSTFAGRYTIIEELGRGGMGVVYKAEDTKLKRTVALKFLPPELTHIPEVKERFIREAQAAAALDHPNICTVYEFDEAEDTSFISMAYIEGQNLRKKSESGPLEIEDALRIAKQVAEGLQEAHKKGVVHRDIKSANILVDARGQAKIMDFGLARMTGGTMVTKEGTTMGTVAYMSPEQARGEEVGQRTDIWSLGVVLYEILCGQRPFEGDHEQTVLYSILNKNPKPIMDLKADIPASIEQVVSKALEKDPDKRYQQIDDLLDDLKSISAGIVPEEIKVRVRKEKLRKRKKAILYAGAAVVIVALVVVALSLFTGQAEAIESIAVLPLENLTGDPEQEYFVDGITDELIGHLGQISGLSRVISRTSVMQYKKSEKSLSEIARELNVDAVVEGAVHLVGENVRMRIQLIAALPKEQNLWGRTYERDKSDVFVMYSEMARAIANEIQIKLTPQEEILLARPLQINQEAYEAYLKGLSHFYKLTPLDLETAQGYFESALERDPNYAQAHTGIALVWIGLQQMGAVPPSEATPKAKEAVRKAESLDDTLAEVYYAQALIKTWSDWDWEGGEIAFKRALEINPNYPDARVYYSNLLCYLGRPDEAVAQGERALELDPLNSLLMGIYGLTLGMIGRNDEAITQALNALRTSPNDPPAHSLLWEVFHIQEKYDEALVEGQAFFTGIEMAPLVELMKQGYEKDGYFGAMRLVADTMAAFSKETFVPPFYVAYVYAFAGEKGKTLEWLEIAYEKKDPSLPYIGGEGVFTNFLHDNPHFQDLLWRMNFPKENDQQIQLKYMKRKK